MQKSALILVDLQNDLLPGGALPISSSSEIIPLANQIMNQFDFVVATKNWHPENHISFLNNHPEKKSGDTILVREKIYPLQPPHCIQNTTGAKLSDELDTNNIHHILHKGTQASIHSYSAFFDHEPHHATGLHTLLKFHQIKKVTILGLSIDQSVEHTALDAARLGYEVYVLLDCCRSLNTESNECELNYLSLTGTSIKLINSTDLHTMPEQLAFAFYDE